PIGVASSPTEWIRKRGKRIAGVSSFGFSGTNAHVILSDAPLDGDFPRVAGQSSPSLERNPSPQLLLLSAQSEAALLELAGSYHRLFHEKPDLELKDVCL